MAASEQWALLQLASRYTMKAYEGYFEGRAEVFLWRLQDEKEVSGGRQGASFCPCPRILRACARACGWQTFYEDSIPSSWRSSLLAAT